MDIVLLEPEIPENIGFITRVMANFDFNKLIIVNPQCEYNSLQAIKTSKHAKEILNSALILNRFEEVIKKYNIIIGTTGIQGTDFNIPRSPLTPKQLAEHHLDSNSALVFGREGQGMHNEEIMKCDYVVTIPSSVKYGTLNISHAVAVVLYELFQRTNNAKITDNFPLISKEMKNNLLGLITEKLDKLKFTTEEKRESQIKLWKKILGKSYLTRREGMALFGFFKKI